GRGCARHYFFGGRPPMTQWGAGSSPVSHPLFFSAQTITPPCGGRGCARHYFFGGRPPMTQWRPGSSPVSHPSFVHLKLLPSKVLCNLRFKATLRESAAVHRSWK